MSIPIPTRASMWAADQWSKLQEGKEGSWKRKAYVRSRARGGRETRDRRADAVLLYRRRGTG